MSEGSDFKREAGGVVVNNNTAQYNARKVIKKQAEQINSLNERLTIIEKLLEGKF